MPYLSIHPGHMTAVVIPLTERNPDLFNVHVEFWPRRGRNDLVEVVADVRDAAYWRFMVAGIAELNQRWSSTQPEDRPALTPVAAE